MSNLSLYKIADTISDLLDNGIDEDGVMSEELGAALGQFEDKGQAVTAYILNCDANAAMIRVASCAMAKRAEPLEKRAMRLRQYLAENMKRTGITQISASDGSFEAKLLLERDVSVDVFDSDQLPADYWRTPEPKPPVAAPDKKLIAAAIKDGFTVPGARIVKADRLVLK
jgi:hypothetical protein